MPENNEAGQAGSQGGLQAREGGLGRGGGLRRQAAVPHLGPEQLHHRDPPVDGHVVEGLEPPRGEEKDLDEGTLRDEQVARAGRCERPAARVRRARRAVGRHAVVPPRRGPRAPRPRGGAPGPRPGPGPRPRPAPGPPRPPGGPGIPRHAPRLPPPGSPPSQPGPRDAPAPPQVSPLTPRGSPGAPPRLPPGRARGGSKRPRGGGAGARGRARGREDGGPGGGGPAAGPGAPAAGAHLHRLRHAVRRRPPPPPSSPPGLRATRGPLHGVPLSSPRPHRAAAGRRS